MIEPAGQVRTEIQASGSGDPGPTVISAGRDVEQGARSMLLLAEGLFRLDVVPEGDMVQTILRNLSAEGRIELRLHDVGGQSIVLPGPGQRGGTVATGRFGGEVVLGAGEEGERVVAKLVVGSVRHLDRGVTTFTAQATLPAEG